MHNILHPLALVLLALGAQAVMKDRCPWAIGKFPFDAEKFAGQWHVIACASNMEESEGKRCSKYDLVNFKSGEEVGFNVKFTEIGKDSKEISYEGFSRTYKADKPSMFLGVWKKADEDKYDGIYKQTLIASDYDNYAVFLACKPEFDKKTKTFGRHLMASVLSRKPTLDEDVKNTLINVLSGYDVNISSLKTIDHTDCSA